MKKTGICLCLVFTATCLVLHAEDNPAQAAARAALVKMLMDSNPPQTQPVSNTTSLYAIEPPAELATAKTNPAPASPPAANAVSMPASIVVPPDAPPAVAPPVAVVPAPVPTKVIPAPAAPIIKTEPVVAPTAPKPARPMILGNTPNPSAQAKPGTELVTVYGTVYKNTQVEKVYWDGILISYSMSGGGIGMTKVYFKDLPPDVRQQYEK